jgi:hypothetical protein
MNDSFILTGYNENSLSLVNSLLDNGNNEIAILLDKYVDLSQCKYGDDDEGTPIGLEGSSLLSRLPWLTPWEDLFKPNETVKVCYINRR